MDFVLVLILAFLSTGQSYNKYTEQKCYILCPAGFYKVGECDDPVAKNRCEKCDNNSFTAEANSINKCERCSTCGNYLEPIKDCTHNSNVVCDCKEGYYRKTMLSHDSNYCLKCKCKNCEDVNKYPDYKKKCPPCQSCLENLSHLPPSTNSSTAASTSTSPATRTTASKNTSNPFVKPVPPKMNEMSWLFLVVVLVTLLLFLWLLLLFARSPFRYLDSCLCCSVNKRLDLPLEDPHISEQSSHQGSSPNTLTINISERSPMMTLSQNPAMPEHLTHISSRDNELKAIRQHGQSDHWPAIVLYAIIKEVPLRRWKEFLRLLSVTDQQLERVELDAGLGLCSMERQYQMLRLWSQCSSVSLNDVFSALHYMDLSGCAQLLQESLEKLQFAGLN